MISDIILVHIAVAGHRYTYMCNGRVQYILSTLLQPYFCHIILGPMLGLVAAFLSFLETVLHLIVEL